MFNNKDYDIQEQLTETALRLLRYVEWSAAAAPAPSCRPVTLPNY